MILTQICHNDINIPELKKTTNFHSYINKVVTAYEQL